MLSAWVRIVISSREPSSVILGLVGLGRDWVLAIPRFTGWLRDPSLVEQDRHDERDLLGVRSYLNQMRWYSRLCGCNSSATRAPSKKRFRIRGKPSTSVPATATSSVTWSTAAPTARK